MEGEMRVLSQAEIARLTKSELHALLRVIASELPRLSENSPELRAAHFNLRNVRIALARPEFRPR
jgi:hypothetical protein